MNSFNIDSVKLKDTTVKLEVSDDKTVTVFVMFAIDYFALNLKEGQTINGEQYQELKKLHSYCFAYQKCLKKLTNRDLSVREIQEILDAQLALDQLQKQQIIDNLKELGLLDDEALIINRIEYDQARLTGKKKTEYDLEERGLDRELVRRYTEEVSFDAEVERCRQKAALLHKVITKKSFRETMADLRRKLAAGGFEAAVISAAIGGLDFEADEETERENLKSAVNRALRQYSRNLEGLQLRRKVFNYCLAKGFSKDVITDILNTMEAEENED